MSIKPWKENIREITGVNIITYVDYLNALYVLGLNERSPENAIKTGDLCYFYFPVQEPYLATLPRHFMNRYILCRFMKVFPSSDDIIDGDEWIVTDTGEITTYSCLFSFSIIGEYKTKEELLKQSRIHGFRKVIDDNEYYSQIPLINELWHWDNGIISHAKVTLSFTLNPDKDKWDEFTVSHEIIIDENFAIEKMLNEGHTNPER